MMVVFTGGESLVQRVSQGSGALRIGVEYCVLEVFAQADGANKFRIHFSNIELPSLFDSRLFEVSSSRIPQGWCITKNGSGSLTVGPEEWVRPGFWEAFVDREEWAVKLYEIGREKSLS